MGLKATAILVLLPVVLAKPAFADGVFQDDRASRELVEKLEAGIEPSVGSVGDSYDNALAGWTHCVQQQWPVQD